MNHDTLRNDHAKHSRAADFSDAVPRGSILRSTEPVVAPVAPAGAAYDNRTLDDERPGRVIDEPAADASASGMGAATGATRTYGATDETYGVAGTGDVTRVDDAPGARPVRMHGVSGVRERRFSLGATFLGWAVASFFSLVFTSIVLLAVGGVAAGDAASPEGLTAGDFTTLGVAAFVGILVAMFLAYLIGGYAAGRIAHFDGAKHGAGVPVWTILFALLGILLGAAFGPQLTAYVTMPAVAGIDWAALTGYGVLGILAMILVAFAGAILGGKLGARHDQRHEGAVVERRRAFRGRPL